MLLFVLPVFGQSDAINIQWGQPYKSKQSIVTNIVQFDNGQFYAINQRIGALNQSVYLQKYSDLGPVMTRKIEVKRSTEKDITKDFIRLGNELWVLNLESTFDYARLQARMIDPDNLEETSDQVDVIDLRIEQSVRYAYGSYDYGISSDHKRIGFVTHYPGYKNTNAVLGFQIYDENFDLSWEKDVTLKLGRDLIDIVRTEIATDGSVYSLIKVYQPSESNEFKRSKEYNFRMIRINRDGELASSEITMSEGNRIQFIHFQIGEDNQIMLAGFYGSTCCTIQGSFFQRFDSKLNQVHSNERDFKLDFITEGLSPKKKERMKIKEEAGDNQGFENVDFRDFVVKKDGGLILIGELYEVNAGQSKNSVNATGENVFLSYNSILVVSIDASGEIQWSKKILKRQLAIEDGGLMSGFFLAVNDDKVHIIFNDHKDNLDVKLESDLVTYRREKSSSIVTLVTIDSDGDLTREQLLSQKEIGLEIRPRSCEQLSSDQLLLFGMSNSINQMALVTL